MGAAVAAMDSWLHRSHRHMNASRERIHHGQTNPDPNPTQASEPSHLSAVYSQLPYDSRNHRHMNHRTIGWVSPEFFPDRREEMARHLAATNLLRTCPALGS